MEPKNLKEESKLETEPLDGQDILDVDEESKYKLDLLVKKKNDAKIKIT